MPNRHRLFCFLPNFKIKNSSETVIRLLRRLGYLKRRIQIFSFMKKKKCIFSLFFTPHFLGFFQIYNSMPLFQIKISVVVEKIWCFITFDFSSPVANHVSLIKSGSCRTIEGIYMTIGGAHMKNFTIGLGVSV